MKLRDIPPGSEVAYAEALHIVIDQLVAEVETCERLLGIDPEMLLAVLASLLNESLERKQEFATIVSHYLS